MKKAPQRLLDDFLQTLNSEGAGSFSRGILFGYLVYHIIPQKRKKENEYRLR
jgi:hypothetical protein